MKLKLDKTYTFAGKYYGPGETEVPEEAAKSIQERMSAAEAGAVRTDSTSAGAQNAADGNVEASSEDAVSPNSKSKTSVGAQASKAQRR